MSVAGLPKRFPAVTVNQTPRNFVANAAVGEVEGVELEAQAKPATVWDFNLGVGDMDTEYTSVRQGASTRS